MDGEEIQHEFIYVDEAGFNLTRTRRRGRNIIGHRAIVNVPGQRGGDITLVQPLHRMGSSTAMPIWALTTALILTFLDQLHNITAANQIDHMQYIVCLGQCVFPPLCSGSELVSATSTFHRPISSTILSIPQPIEEFFSAWRWWKVYDLRLQAEVPLIQAMEEACDQMEVAAMQGWIRHSRRFFPRCC